MYKLSGKVKLISIILIVIGALGIGYGFLTAPSTIDEAKEILAAEHSGHGEGHEAESSHSMEAEGHHSEMNEQDILLTERKQQKLTTVKRLTVNLTRIII